MGSRTQAFIYEEKHPRLIRWTHWINFPLLGLMTWSGLLIYWANDVYSLGIGRAAFHFFPDSVYRLLKLDHGLALGMGWHFTIGWLFVLNGGAYVAYALFSGEWRQLLPKRRDLSGATQVLLHDLGLRTKLPAHGKFNSAQKIAYTAIILMGFGSIVTGFAIYKPIQLNWLRWVLGGYEAARFEHFWLMIGTLTFFLVHVIQVIRAGWANFLSMVTGFEKRTKESRP